MAECTGDSTRPHAAPLQYYKCGLANQVGISQPSETGSPVDNADGSSLSEEEIRAAIQELKTGRVNPETIAVLTDGIPSYTTVNVGELDSVQLVLLRSLARLNESGLTKVRWGNLMAPEGSPDYKQIFVTVWTTAGDTTTVKIRSSGT